MIYPFPDKGFLGRGLKLADPLMKGNDVIAWQLYLGIQADGVFGRQTHGSTEAFQRNMGLTADGIVGPLTFRAGCLLTIKGVGAGVVAGLPQGMVEGESRYWMGASSPTYVRDGHRKADVGAVQLQTVLSDEPAVLRALNPQQAIGRLCNHLRDGQEQYRTAAYVRRHDTPQKLSWWLACGRWNAPAWTDIWASRGPNDPSLQVLVTHPFLGLITREEWVRHYVSEKIIYVKDWSS